MHFHVHGAPEGAQINVFVNYTPEQAAQRTAAQRKVHHFVCSNSECKSDKDVGGYTITPERRKGPSGNKDLCNQCGLNFSKFGNPNLTRTKIKRKIKASREEEARALAAAPAAAEVFNRTVVPVLPPMQMTPAARPIAHLQVSQSTTLPPLFQAIPKPPATIIRPKLPAPNTLYARAMQKRKYEQNKREVHKFIRRAEELNAGQAAARALASIQEAKPAAAQKPSAANKMALDYITGNGS